MSKKIVKKKIKFYKVLRLMLVLFFVATCGFFIKDATIAYAANYVIDNEKLIEETKPTSFLFIGTDGEQTNASGARSDVIMVATVTQKNARGNVEVNIVTVPRDTVANITCGKGYSRINEAYAIGYLDSGDKGGALCTKQTVEEYLNIKIDYYVSTSFKGFMQLVDAVGGIEVDVPYDMYEQDSQANSKAIELKAGVQTLNGEQALGYVRQRKLSSEYERGMRQQEMMMTLVRKIVANPTKYLGSLISVFTNSMESNLSVDIITKMVGSVITNYNNFIENQADSAPIIIQLKSSKFSNLLNIDSSVARITNVDVDNVKKVPLDTLYENIDSFEAETKVQEYYFSKRASTTASRIPLENANPLIVELQSISILAEEFNAYGASVSNPAYDTLYYVSNVLRKALGMAVETPPYDYKKVVEMGGYKYHRE